MGVFQTTKNKATMKKYYAKQKINVTMPNGIEVEAAVIRRVAHEAVRNNKGVVAYRYDTYLCYAQNRLFIYIVKEDDGEVDEFYRETVCHYCIIPKYDELLSV